MNVKSVWNSLANIAEVSRTKLDHRAKTDASADKDTNLGQGQEEAAQHRMTEEEAEQVLAYLKEVDGVKDNNLQVRLTKENERYVIFVEDIHGKVVRRLPENELWFVLKSKGTTDSKKGQIFNKAM